MKPSLLLAIIASCAATVSAADQPWMGAWQGDGQPGPGSELRFEAHRATLKNPGHGPQFFAADYDAPGTIWLRNGNGGMARLVVKISGDKLTIVSGASTTGGTYHRVAKVPDDLDYTPVAIPDTKPVSDERKAAISAEADKRTQDDQAALKDPARRDDLRKIAIDDCAWVKTVIAEVGWPDAERFGSETTAKVFTFVQHGGDLPLMLGVLPCYEKDMTAKVIDAQDFSQLYDRLLMGLGRPQRYGTQLIRDEHHQPVLWLLADKANVEKLRADIGLIPLSMYMQMAGQSMGATVRFMDSARYDVAALAKKDDGGAANAGGETANHGGETAKKDGGDIP